MSIISKGLRIKTTMEHNSFDQSMKKVMQQVKDLRREYAELSTVIEAQKENLADLERQREKMANSKNVNQAALAGLDKFISQLKDDIGENEKKLESLGDSITKLGEKSNKLGMLSKGFKMLKLSIVGAIGGAVGKLFTAFFTDTYEGQMKLANVTGYLKGAYGELKDKIIEVTKTLTDIFTGPREELKQFANDIKTQLIDSFVHFGESFRSAVNGVWHWLKGDKTAASESFQNMWSEGGQIVPEKLKDAVKEINDAGKEGIDLEKRRIQLEKQSVEWAGQRARLERELNEARRDSVDVTKTEQERTAALEKAYELTKKIAQGDSALVGSKLALAKANMGSNPTVTDIQTISQLTAEYNNLKATEEAAIAEIADEQREFLYTLAMTDIELQNQSLENRLENNRTLQREIAEAYEDGFLTEQEYNDKLHELKMQQIADEKAQRDLEMKQLEMELANDVTKTDEQKKTELDTARKRNERATQDSYDTETREYKLRQQKLYVEDLRAYGDYLNKKKSMELDLQQELRDIELDRTLTASQKAEKKMTAQTNYEATLSSMTAELPQGFQEVLGQETELLEGLVDMSIKELRDLVDKCRRDLDAVKGDTNATAVAQAKLAVASQALANAEEELNRINANKLADRNKAYEELLGTLSNVVGAVNEVADAMGDLLSDEARDGLNTINTVAGSTISMIRGIQAVSESGAIAIRTLEDASVILGIISAAVQALMAIVNLYESHFSKAAKTQKQLDNYADQLHSLQREQKKFEDSLDSKVGEDYWKTLYKAAENYDSQISNLEAQRELAAQKVSEVHGKKKKAEAKAQLEDIEDALQSAMDNQQSMWQSFFNEMLTTDVTSFANGIADAMLDAAKDGAEGISSAFDDTVDGMVRAMMKAQLSRQITSLFEPAFKEMENLAKDGVLSQDDIAKTVAMLDQNKAQAVAMVQAVDEYMEASGMNSGAKASSGGLTAITESTASELNGRFTDIQYKMAQIAASINSTFGNGMLLTAVTDIQANVDASREHLSDIAKYTRSLEAMSGALDRISKKVERL